MDTENYKEALSRAFGDACVQLSPAGGADATIQRPRNPSHGDYACAIAMQLAGELRRPPPDIAADILRRAALPDFVEKADVVGGYINIRLTHAAKTAVIGEALRRGPDFGRGEDNRQTLLVEFVSANPTGPLHIGHGRAAAYGDSLANILDFAGFEVRREYYVNDAGLQSEVLAGSAWLRRFLTDGEGQADMPHGAYRGEYLAAALPAAEPFLKDAPAPDSGLSERMSAASTEEAASMLAAAARESMGADRVAKLADAVSGAVLDMIKADLQALNVKFDRWFFEHELHDEGLPESAIEALREKDPGHIYEKDGALWFRSTQYGDDKDRVLRRANGQLTYFAADVAYHRDKLERDVSAERRLGLINVLGADHHGYVPRLSAAVAALGGDPKILEAQIIQFVALLEDGRRVKMSTRAGEFVALSDLVAKAGADAARFFYVSRKNDQRLDFDIALAAKQSAQNPVYYLQYAHARAAAIFRKWGGDLASLTGVDCAPIAEDPAAMALCAQTGIFPSAVTDAAAERAPHLLANYLRELAAHMHDYYEKTRILAEPPDAAMTARLALLAAAQTALRNGLSLLGVSAPESM